jgi:hypothetical protein
MGGFVDRPLILMDGFYSLGDSVIGLTIPKTKNNVNSKKRPYIKQAAATRQMAAAL